MDEFTGKVALVTGAGRGRGREVARAFASLGVRVAANDISPLNLDETVRLIRQAGGEARGYVFDVAKRMPVEGMLSQVMDHFGRIDFLVSHASVEPEASILDMDEWDFHRTLDVNLGGPFFCTQLVGRLMRQQGGGAMVMTISPQGQDEALKGQAAHAASQAGLAGLTRAAAAELFKYRIRLNAACETSWGGETVAMSTIDMAVLHHWQQSFPKMQLGAQSEWVSLVLYLCSDAAASINGQVLAVNRPGEARR